MNSLLVKYGPKDMPRAKWQELWENSHPQLKPLADVLKHMIDQEPSIRPDDFMVHNHYAKLVAELVKKQTLKDILALLPESAQK